MDSKDSLSKPSRNNNNTVRIFIIFSLILASVVLIPIAIKQVVEIRSNMIKDNMEEIYRNAETVENIGTGLGEDVDSKGVYIKLSEMSDKTVYNKTKENSYSLTYNSTNGNYYVKYGGKYQYPEVNDEKSESETLDANSLFNYSMSRAGVSIEGLSEEGLSELSTSSVLEIPKILGGETVVEIAPNSFAGLGFEAVIIPSTVKKVGQGAFDNNGVDRDSQGDLSAPFAGRWVIEGKEWINK